MTADQYSNELEQTFASLPGWVQSPLRPIYEKMDEGLKWVAGNPDDLLRAGHSYVQLGTQLQKLASRQQTDRGKVAMVLEKVAQVFQKIATIFKEIKGILEAIKELLAVLKDLKKGSKGLEKLGWFAAHAGGKAAVAKGIQYGSGGNVVIPGFGGEVLKGGEDYKSAWDDAGKAEEAAG